MAMPTRAETLMGIEKGPGEGDCWKLVAFIVGSSDGVVSAWLILCKIKRRKGGTRICCVKIVECWWMLQYLRNSHSPPPRREWNKAVFRHQIEHVL